MVDGNIYMVFPHPRPPVRGEEPQPTRGDPFFFAEHSRFKAVNLENLVGAMPMR